MDNISILVVRTDRIGELLLTVPLVSALRQAYPKARLTVVANPGSASVLEGNADINELIPLRQTEGESWWRETVRFLRALDRRSFDIAFVVNSKKAYHLGTRLKRIPVRIGFKRKWASLLTHALTDERRLGKRHEVMHNVSLLEPLVGSVTPEAPDFTLDSSSEAWAHQWFKDRGWGTQQEVIALSPFSTHPKKEWYARGFTEVARALLEDENRRVLFLGAASDKGRSQKLASDLGGHAVNLCGQTTLRQAAALLARSRLLVSNDSGLVHIAAGLRIPTVVLFRNAEAADSPKRWGPYGKGHVVLQSPAGQEHQGEPPFTEVIQVCRKQIQRHRTVRQN